MWLVLILLFMPQFALGAPISVDIDKNVNLAIGQRTFGPVAVPDDLSTCTFTIDRTNWTNASPAMSMTLDVSINNGPFTFWLGMTSQGSTFDAQLPATKLSRALPAGTNRRVQGNYVVAGARFVSTVSVACN